MAHKVEYYWHKDGAFHKGVRETALWPDWQQYHGFDISQSERKQLDSILLKRRCRNAWRLQHGLAN